MGNPIIMTLGYSQDDVQYYQMVLIFILNSVTDIYLIIWGFFESTFFLRPMTLCSNNESNLHEAV